MFRFDYDKVINMYKSREEGRWMRKAPSLGNIELATENNTS